MSPTKRALQLSKIVANLANETGYLDYLTQENNMNLNMTDTIEETQSRQVFFPPTIPHTYSSGHTRRRSLVCFITDELISRMAGLDLDIDNNDD